MFLPDAPIETRDEDLLNRVPFAQNLARALLDWKQTESLVVGLYGDWGSGKSSIINLLFEAIRSERRDQAPTILYFNPWRFSGQNAIEEAFFTEVSKELRLKDEKTNRVLAEKLLLYSKIVSLAPTDSGLERIISNVLLAIGTFGIAGSILTAMLTPLAKWIVAIGAVILLIAGLSANLMRKCAEILESRVNLRNLTSGGLKERIQSEMSKRQQKLLIVIDDIDRLGQEEVRSIFKVVRVSADFPNTLYLLAFDRKVVVRHLCDTGVSGEDFLEKIVQVSFDVPYVKDSTISSVLFRELGRILDQLPERARKRFEKTHWQNIYHSGFKSYFSNLRDVKRYTSSLSFTLSLMHREDSIEVNPVDFFAIEAIRVFCPDFYERLKSSNTQFTSTGGVLTTKVGVARRRTEIEDALSHIPKPLKDTTTELLKRLFPQLDSVIRDQGYLSYGGEWQSKWAKDLRVCATEFFDRYFMLAQVESTDLTQLEIDKALDSMVDKSAFTGRLRDALDAGKLRPLLRALWNYADDPEAIPPAAVKNVVEAIFDLSDDIPDDNRGMFEVDLHMEAMRVLYRLLKREPDKTANCALLKDAIRNSTGLYGPIEKVSLESRAGKERDPSDYVVPDDCVKDLQDLCLGKIKIAAGLNLIEHPQLEYILYRWKEWDESGSVQQFVDDAIADNTKMPKFLNAFVGKIRSQGGSDYGFQIREALRRKSLSNFARLDEIERRITELEAAPDGIDEDFRRVVKLFRTVSDDDF